MDRVLHTLLLALIIPATAFLVITVLELIGRGKLEDMPYPGRLTATPQKAKPARKRRR